MAKPEAVFIYIGTYPDEAAARNDYDVVKDLHAANANSFASDAKSAFPSQTTALQNSVSSLGAAITSAKGQPPLTAATAVASSVAQVKTSASALQSAVSGTCQ